MMLGVLARRVPPRAVHQTTAALRLARRALGGAVPPRAVHQTTFGRKGNALQAAFASVLDLDMDAVPNFIDSNDYMASINAFLAPRGLAFLRVDCDGATVPLALDGATCLVVGQSPLGIRQVCVGRTRLADGASCAIDVLHDPHPESHGLVDGSLAWAGIFVALRPDDSSVA